jgi:hypothetical protein
MLWISLEGCLVKIDRIHIRRRNEKYFLCAYNNGNEVLEYDCSKERAYKVIEEITSLLTRNDKVVYKLGEQ